MRYNNHSIFLWCCASIFLLFSCKNSASDSQDPLLTHIDSTVRPQDDFFDYANGGWLKRHPIPDAYKSWGIGYEVQEDLFNRLKIINEKAIESPSDPISKKIAAFYNSGMDSVLLAKQSVDILKDEFGAIHNIKNIPDLLAVNALFSKIGVHSLFSTYIGQDDKNSSQIAFIVAQGGLGLPNRDYYIKTDERTTRIRAAYIKHIAQTFQLAGEDSLSAEVASQQVFTLEKQLAEASRSLEDLRDPYANYHKFSVADYDGKNLAIQWRRWLPEAGLPMLDSLIIGQPDFFVALDHQLSATPIPIWQQYMKWQLLRSLGAYINTDLEQEDFAFYGKVMSGLKSQKPRWKRVLETEQEAMGEALGQLFVKEYFPAKAKARYTALVENIRTALHHRIQNLNWMSAPTKEKALDKLRRMKAKVGYPDHWKDFSAMDIRQQPYVKNVMAANDWWRQREIQKLGKPVDRDEWDMTPQTYNAYYNPSNNEIVLPAGIFTVPGMRDDQLDDAVVYGYAGASTIGHEITHGFDDQGRQYDAQGNLKDWWTKQDAENFTKRAAVIIKQFDGYTPVDSLHINGQATQGENIADLGGILLGWDAFTQTKTYKEGKKINGFTPAERFFMGYALGWLYQIRPETLAQQLLTDVHAPAKYRVNGPFSDVDAFYKTFNVKPGDKMYIADSARVRIW